MKCLIGIPAIALLTVINLPACDADNGLLDDWQYSPKKSEEDSANYASSPSNGGGDMGLATGGANDINNFRENIENGYLPLETDITYEGLYYDYFFDLGDSGPCDALFCPTYSQMLSTDPLTEESEHFISVGLSSGLTEADFARKRLNLTVVLDISGSMSSPFNNYYYDQYGNLQESETISNKAKMEIANEAVVAMLDHLREGDQFAMVLFDDESYLAKPMNPVEITDINAIKGHILDLEPQGGTNMEAGYQEARALYDELHDVDHAVYENRIIFLTDAMPNFGDLSEESLVGMVAATADDKVHTTFIGVGVDFNTELIEAITKVRGANYYSVHSEEKFKARMDEEFEYMVTPVVFDLSLTLESQGFDIGAVYGSPEANQGTGELMKVNTLFPSKTEGNEAKGGIIVLKLTQTGASAEIGLSASYKDRNETSFSTDEAFTFDATEEDVPHTAIRKGVLLARYVRLMKEWIQAEREALGEDPETGLSNWERTSVPLTVSDEYRTAFQTFLSKFAEERTAIGDDNLIQEEEILETLIGWEETSPATL